MAVVGSGLRHLAPRPRLYGVIGGLALFAVIVVALWFAFRTTSPRPVASSHPVPVASSHPVAVASARALIQKAMNRHDFIYPECRPVTSRRWIFPGDASHFASSLYESYAIKYSCQTAATWIRRLSTLRIPLKLTGALEPLKEGPRGYSCGAWPDARGYAYAGGCSDTKTQSSFGWNWNVANPRVAFEYNANNKLVRVKVGGADSITSLIPLKGDPNYEIILLNTSGVGYIKTFKWIPPAGWTIKSIASATGAKCRLASGNVFCSGAVVPPSCLCSGDGGRVVIRMDIQGVMEGTIDGHTVYYGNEGEATDLTSMVPVPFLIPGTTIAAAHQRKGE